MQRLLRLHQAYMSRLSLLLFTLLGLTLTATAQEFQATLSGTSEIPAVTTTASGEVSATLEGNTLTVTGEFSGLMGDLATDIVGGAHLHGGMAGMNAGIAFPLTVSIGDDNRSGSFEADSNRFELSDEQIATLMARSMYVNIHSAPYRGGELRGQVVPASDAVYQAVLTGGSEVPVANSTATGGLVLEVRGDSLFVSGSFSGLQSDYASDVGGGAHLHTAMAGLSGGIAIPLNVTLNDDLRSGTFMTADNAFLLEGDQKDLLMARGMYANIHTADNRPGEIRGQVLPIATAYFEARLSGGAQVPPVDTEGTGGLIAELHDDTVIVTGGFMSLVSDFDPTVAGGAHLHTAMAGATGPIAVPLSAMLDEDLLGGVFMADSNSFAVDDTLLATMMARGVYANIHTVDNRSGELRGQVLPKANLYFQGSLSGLNAVPPIDTAGIGGVAAELHGSTLILSGSFMDLASPFDPNVAGGAHIHRGPIDGTGGIEFRLTTMLDEDLLGGQFMADSNRFVLDPDSVTALQDAQYYVNIHTENNASGEIRAQLLLSPSNMTIVSTPNEREANVPDRFVLHGNYPNPFNPSTTIRFALPQTADVEVTVYDAVGRQVMTLPVQTLQAGSEQTIRLDAGNLASGLYLYRIMARTLTNTWLESGRMVLLR